MDKKSTFHIILEVAQWLFIAFIIATFLFSNYKYKQRMEEKEKTILYECINSDRKIEQLLREKRTLQDSLSTISLKNSD